MKKLRILLKKYDGIIKNKQQLVAFKEPIVFFIRNHGEVEFYEGAKEGKFTFETSNGDTREIHLTPSNNLLTFKYGKNTFKGYICHENSPLPLPEDPILTLEMFGLVIDKAVNDMKKWKAAELDAKGNLIFKIAIGAAVLIGAIAIFKIMVPEKTPQVIQYVATNITAGMTPL